MSPILLNAKLNPLSQMRNAFKIAVVEFIPPDEFLLYDCKMNLFFFKQVKGRDSQSEIYT